MFNPAAIKFDQGVACTNSNCCMPDERDGYIALPHWDHDSGSVAIDWRKLAEP